MIILNFFEDRLIGRKYKMIKLSKKDKTLNTISPL